MKSKYALKQTTPNHFYALRITTMYITISINCDIFISLQLHLHESVFLCYLKILSKNCPKTVIVFGSVSQCFSFSFFSGRNSFDKTQQKMVYAWINTFTTYYAYINKNGIPPCLSSVYINSMWMDSIPPFICKLREVERNFVHFLQCLIKNQGDFFSSSLFKIIKKCTSLSPYNM